MKRQAYITGKKVENMANETLYLKLNKKVKLGSEDVHVKDIGKLFCADSAVENRVKTIKLYHFNENSEDRQVISVLKVIEQIQEIYPNLTVENVGEMDTVVELITKQSPSRPVRILKIILVGLVCFCGTGFTIMAYHNDVGITKLFTGIYEMVMGVPSPGYTVLEFAYSIGLALGILIFFNHIGKRRITRDPTPVEVEMRLYEDDVNTSLVELADREEKTIDVT